MAHSLRGLPLVLTACVVAACRAAPDPAAALPPGAVHVLGTTVDRPGSPVVGMAVVAGGKQLVVSTWDGVALWDFGTGQLARRVPAPPSPRPRAVTRTTTAPDPLNGQVFAADGGKAFVYVREGWGHRYDLPLTDRPPTRLPERGDATDGLYAVAPAGPGGALLALTTADALDFLPAGGWGWERWTSVWGETRNSRRGHLVAGTRLVAAGGEGANVRVWRPTADGKSAPERVASFDTEPVLALALSADDRRIAAFGRDGIGPQTMRFWDVDGGKQLGRWEAFGSGYNAIALSPDGAVLAAANRPRRGFVTLYDPATGEARKELPAGGDFVRFLAFLPDGSGLVAAGVGGVVHSWRLPAGDPVRPVRGHAGPVRAVRLLPGGGAVTGGADGVVVVYDRDGREVRRIPAHPPTSATSVRDEGVTALAASPDGAVLYSAGRDRWVKAWRLATGEKVAEFQPTEPANSASALAVSADGKTVAAGLKREGVRLLAADTLAQTGSVGGVAMQCTGVGFAAGGKVVAFDAASRSVGLWDAATGREVRRVVLTVEKANPKARPRPDDVLSVLDLRVWAGSTLAVSADGTRVAAATAVGADGLGRGVTVWDEDGKEVARLDLGDEPAGVAAFTPDGTRLAVASMDGAVRVFDVASGAVRHTFRGHRGHVLALAASATRLVSGGADTTAVVWALAPKP